MQREGGESVSGDDGLEHHDLLLHQSGEKRTATYGYSKMKRDETSVQQGIKIDSKRKRSR